MPDDEALRRAINREREDQVVSSMIAQAKAEDLEAADRLDAEAQGDLLGWACQRIDFWRNCYFRVQARYDNLRRVCWICFGLAAVEFLIVIYATWGHS